MCGILTLEQVTGHGGNGGGGRNGPVLAPTSGDRKRRSFAAALLSRLFGNRIPGHTTRAPPVGFELATDGIQFYAIANLDRTSDMANISPFFLSKFSPVPATLFISVSDTFFSPGSDTLLSPFRYAFYPRFCFCPFHKFPGKILAK